MGKRTQEDREALRRAESLKPGLSLVTCSMNRTANLIRALPSWLDHPEVSEVVIVDWNSKLPVAEELARAGIVDDRIRIARVYDEPRWVLSYAFNVGFRFAQYDQILKCDADIVLDELYFEQNSLEQGRFIAGNWRAAGDGQQYVNGFFHIHTEDLFKVGGFNEFITTYGWDDDDLYDRLTYKGITRQDVAPGTVTHLDHDDEARMGGRRSARQTAWSDLADQTMFKIRTNRMIATIMPRWEPHLPMRPYVTGLGPLDTTTVRRATGSVYEVPEHIDEMARRLAAREMVSWRAGVRAFALDDETFDLILGTHRLDQITPLVVELAVSGASMTALSMPRALVVDFRRSATDAPADVLAAAGQRLARIAFRSSRLLVVRGPDRTRPIGFTGPLANAPYIPDFAPLGAVRDMAPEDVRRDAVSPVVRLQLDAEALPHLPDTLEYISDQAAAWVDQSLSPQPHPLLAPDVQTGRRDKLYIDAQHGLGNRLRAMGSAHAVAEATGRELVVVWQPDHHCEGHLSDLFAYDGAVETESFVDRAMRGDFRVYNYMEIEPGAAKGAEIVLEPGRDTYVRSAYVLTHPASDWTRENALLKTLTPSEPVQRLLDQAGPPAAIGLHVRMEGAPGTDTNSYDAAENWTPEGHAAIHEWREKSHFKHFMARLDVLLEQTPDAGVFLAADQAETYRAFAESYGAGRISMLERDLFDRSAQQLHFALADMLALSRVTHLLGSNWSSFTEGALRLSDTIVTHEMAGKDF